MTRLQKWMSGAVLIAAPLLLVAATVLLIRIERWEDHMQATHSHPAPLPSACRPLPDPDDCVQLGWLDGAWRCIPTEQAG